MTLTSGICILIVSLTCVQAAEVNSPKSDNSTDCPDGEIRKGCMPTCSLFCIPADSDNSTTCDPTSGACLHGCQDGYTSKSCNQTCPKGRFGKDCQTNCSQDCKVGKSGTPVCDNINGTCSDGCLEGYTTSWCNERCVVGTYGEGCKSNCSQFCFLNEKGVPDCDHINGTCECQIGYDTPWCNQSCQAGKFGDGCTTSCSEFCMPNDKNIPDCDHINGTCACISGYESPWCNQSCTVGWFGEGCRSACSKFCLLNKKKIPECDNFNGTCECQSGYHTPWCNETCSAGWFGEGCRSVCSQTCALSKKKIPECDPISGTCKCQSGYDTPWCNQTCITGKFGEGCQSSCSEFCVAKENNIPNCNHVNGSCDCLSGYDTPWCNQTCATGKFGEGCQSTCSKFCVLNKSNSPECNHINGTCECQSGYDTPWCNNTCIAGKFGEGCQSTCSEFCLPNNETIPECDHIIGTCQCQSGYNTPWCNKTCPVGTFGQGCSSNCSQFCLANDQDKLACDHINGTCKCKAGYDTPWCNQSCPEGTFGEDCGSHCSQSCKLNKNGRPKCDHINGTCECQIGFDTPWCNQTCTEGTFGEGCRLTCSEFCVNSNSIPECDHITGTCECQSGYDTPWCNQTCPAGTFGESCSLSCSVFCLVSSSGISQCDHISGTCQCLSGYDTPLCSQKCPEGKYGEGCNSSCSAHCALNQKNIPECDHINGTCECQSGYDTAWCNQVKTDSPASSPGTIAGAVLGVIAAVVIIGAFILWRRRKAKLKYHKGDSRCGEDLKVITSVDGKSLSGTELTNISNTDLTDPGVYYNTVSEHNSTIIPLKDLDTFLATHTRGFFQAQFSTICINYEATMNEGQRMENRHKNRYRNIIPYDHSRVHLTSTGTQEHDDYINASHIQGYDGVETFIASQGPTKLTFEDFIRMLWEQNTETIVMLANLMEQGREKCDRYWPEDKEMKVGEFTIILTSTQVFAEFTIRKLQLIKNGKPDHLLTHFHFTAWPDLDVPVTPWGLVDFEQRVQSSPTNRPIVVHCSAGVGRTGTFIALRNAIRQAEDKGYLDIFTTVQKLRHDRINMVQTSRQYEFLHKAVQIAILCKGTTVMADHLHERITYMETMSDSGQTNMEKEFKTICALTHDGSCGEEELAEDSPRVYDYSHSVMNKHKNRLNSILPKILYTPILQCETENLGDYINAVFVPSFSKQNQHFLTQLPLPTTVTDFWRLVTQYNISLIVSFEDDLKATDQTIGEYLPFTDKQAVTFSLFELESETLSTNKLWQQRKVTITVDTAYVNTKLSTSAALKEEHAVTHLKFMTTDLDPENFLSLITQIRSLNPSSQGRTLYMCRNGADYSGLACVLSLLLDRMDHDGCSTVPLVVGAIKAIRPQVIPTLAQYQFLYHVLGHYCQSNSTSSNM